MNRRIKYCNYKLNISKYTGLYDLPAKIFQRCSPGIPVNAEIGVVAVFITENMAEITANNKLKDKLATVDIHKLYNIILGSF